MKKIATLALAASIAGASVVTTSPTAFAQSDRYHRQYAECTDHHALLGDTILLGILLGAVTGGVGGAVVFGSAYAVGGAAVGGGAGLLLSSAHHNRYGCQY